MPTKPKPKAKAKVTSQPAPKPPAPASTSARPARARTSSSASAKPKQKRTKVSKQPATLASMPNKLLEMIKRRVRSQADVLSLAATCKASWAKWGRPDDWPRDHFDNDNDGPKVFAKYDYVPLFYLKNAPKGQFGAAPFYIEGIEYKENGGFALAVAEIGNHNLDRLGADVKLDHDRWARELREKEYGNDGGLDPECRFELDWFEVRHDMLSATPAWIHDHFPCETCGGRFVVQNGNNKLERQ